MSKKNFDTNSINNERKNGAARKISPAGYIAGVGMFSALAMAVSFATSFIDIGYLTFDAGDFIIVLASFIYGPAAGLIIAALNSLVSFLYSGTGPWGLLMDFVSSGTFAFVASMIYRGRKNFEFAIIGIYAAIISVTGIMMPMNILVTPLYTGAPRAFIIEQLPIFLLPFNFAKALFNGALVLLIYKPLVTAMRRAKLLPPSEYEGGLTDVGDDGRRRISKTTVMTIVLGGVSVAVAIAGLVVLAVTKR